MVYPYNKYNENYTYRKYSPYRSDNSSDCPNYISASTDKISLKNHKSWSEIIMSTIILIVFILSFCLVYYMGYRDGMNVYESHVPR